MFKFMSEVRFNIGAVGVNIAKLDLANGEIEIHLLAPLGLSTLNVHINRTIGEDRPKTEVIFELWEAKPSA